MRSPLTRPLDSQAKVCFNGHQESDQTKEDAMTTLLTADMPLEQRIARHWTNAEIATALAQVAPGHPCSPRWTPAMKRAVRAEAARRLAEGDS